jgi:hypothetical protein
MSNEDDLDIDDIVENLDKKKKIKSGRKGKSGEREIVNDLNERFADLLAKNPTWGAFSRSVGSGNRWGQNVHLPQHAKDTFTGDLVAPSNFKFVIESKRGYNDIDLFDCFSGKCTGLDEFLKQVTDDSVRSGRKPLLIWKKDRKPKLAFVTEKDFDGQPAFRGHSSVLSTFLFYKEWVGMPLQELLLYTDDFFFNL